MGVGANVSFLISSAVSLGIVALLSLSKAPIAVSPMLTVVGGFVVSLLFVFLLTAISNLEAVIFGDGYQAKFFPEVAVALLMSLIVGGSVHRVCVTTGFAFSAIALYYLHVLSQKIRMHNQSHIYGRSRNRTFNKLCVEFVVLRNVVFLFSAFCILF